MILVLPLLSALLSQKPGDIMKSVIAKYKSMKVLECTYKTTAPGSNTLIYEGSISYKIKDHMRFSISDPKQECTAGEDLDAKGKGSTWVTPADMRGYNDTLMNRHPYLLVRFIRNETSGHIGTGWLDKLETINRGKSTYWRIRSNDDSDRAITIDSKTLMITEFSSAETYHSKVRLTTYVKYK